MLNCAILTPNEDHWKHLEAAIQLRLPALLKANVAYVRVLKHEIAMGCQVYVVVCPFEGRNRQTVLSEIGELSKIAHLVIEDSGDVDVGQLERVAQRAADTLRRLSSI